MAYNFIYNVYSYDTYIYIPDFYLLIFLIGFASIYMKDVFS